MIAAWSTAMALAAPWAGPFEVVDALGWAADEREVRRWLREARSKDGIWAASLQPAFRSGRARHRPLVAVEAELLEYDARRLVHVREAVVYTNPSRTPLKEVTFRVFGNGELGPDAARILDLRVDGRPVPFALQGTLLTIDLPEPLRPRDHVRIWLDVVEELAPFDPTLDLDGARQVTAQDVGLLGHTPDAVNLGGFVPLPTPVNDDGVFDRRPIPVNGEYAVFDPVNVHAVLDLPADWGVATTGVTVRDHEGQGRHSLVTVAADVRDYVAVMGRDLDVQSFEVDGLQVRVLAPSDEALMARHLNRWSRRSIQVLTETYGPLSMAELDVVEGPLRIALGQEFPQVALVDLHHKDGRYTRHGDHLWTVAHEIAHQWFSMEVGSDARDAPWLDEALATHASSLVVEDMMGRNAVLDQHRIDVLQPLADLGVEGRVRADLPGEAYSIFQYSAVVYGRASLFVDGVREALGAERFAETMRAYVEEHRHQMADDVDLLDALRGAADDPDHIDRLYLQFVAGPQDPGAPAR